MILEVCFVLNLVNITEVETIVELPDLGVYTTISAVSFRTDVNNLCSLPLIDDILSEEVKARQLKVLDSLPY